jgi:hypothetical protein
LALKAETAQGYGYVMTSTARPFLCIKYNWYQKWGTASRPESADPLLSWVLDNCELWIVEELKDNIPNSKLQNIVKVSYVRKLTLCYIGSGQVMMDTVRTDCCSCGIITLSQGSTLEAARHEVTDYWRHQWLRQSATSHGLPGDSWARWVMSNGRTTSAAEVSVLDLLDCVSQSGILSVCLSVCLYVCMSVCTSVCLYVYMYAVVIQSVSFSQSVCLLVCGYWKIHTKPLSACLPYIHTCLFVCLLPPEDSIPFFL